jgi:hypothetical protein
MEGSKETLSTRDLAQPNEPVADDGAVGDSMGDGPQGESVYDQEQGGREAAAGDIPAREQTRAEATGASGPATPTGDAATPAGRGDGVTGATDQTGATTTSGVRAESGTDADADSARLLPADATSSFQVRWEEVQTRFVDEPRGAVEEADGLVANLMQQLAEGFAQERERLETQWDRGEDISTEDLRVTLQRYRSFFQRLLSA